MRAITGYTEVSNSKLLDMIAVKLDHLEKIRYEEAAYMINGIIDERANAMKTSFFRGWLSPITTFAEARARLMSSDYDDMFYWRSCYIYDSTIEELKALKKLCLMSDGVTSINTNSCLL